MAGQGGAAGGGRGMTRAELAAKVEYEGGTFAALEYGIRSDDIADPEIAALWRDLEERYQALSPICQKIDSLLGSSR